MGSELRQDDKGFFKFIGKDEAGKYTRFRLGHDKEKATLAVAKVSTLWQRLQEHGEAHWMPLTLAIAKAIAHGHRSFVIPLDFQVPEYAVYGLTELRQAYGDLITLLPNSPQLHADGITKLTLEHQQAQNRVETYYAPLIGNAGAGSLYEALDAYIAHLKENQTDETGWGRTKVREAETLRQRHEDLPLTQLTLAKMEDMLRFLGTEATEQESEKAHLSTDG